jgi:hypothetical protein
MGGQTSISGGAPVTSRQRRSYDKVRAVETVSGTCFSASIASREEGEERVEMSTAAVSFGCSTLVMFYDEIDQVKRSGRCAGVNQKE